MKKLSTYLFLLLFSFQTSSWSFEIEDFQIEGMSIGDSILDYFSYNEIQENILTDYYTYVGKGNKFIGVGYFLSQSFTHYDDVLFSVKSNDKRYIIYGMSFYTFYENYRDCLKALEEIDDELSNIKFVKRSAPIIDWYGEPGWHYITYDFPLGGQVDNRCLNKKSNEWGGLILTLYNKELKDWIGTYHHNYNFNK